MRKDPPKRNHLREPAPLTANDVDAMWHRAMARGPYPDASSCANLAEVLNESWHHGAAAHLIEASHSAASIHARALLGQVKLALEPIRTAFKSEELPKPYFGTDGIQALELLERALERALPFLSPKESPGEPIWEVAAQMAWEAASRELRQLRRKVGDTANAAAVKFAAEATVHIGFVGVTANAVAKRLAKLRAVRERVAGQ